MTPIPHSRSAASDSLRRTATYRERVAAFCAAVLALALSYAAPVAAEPADNFDPHPATEDLVLPMPNGARMVFRPVFLGIGDDPLATKAFEMGDKSGANYKEIARPAKLGGHFLGSNGGRKDWLLYFGKYEVTRSQYEAVVGATAAKAGGIPQPRLPQTNLTRREIDDFVDAFNAWLSKNAPDKLPKNSGSRGWLRLPTEEEWEFAARGGTAVSAGSFAARTPYSADLAKFEWFAGARSSYGKLKEIGLLEPNPLGIFDLLGNAAEMTNTLYQLDGRTGGYTIRGGSFRTAAEDVRASLRTEQPQYDRDGRPSHDETIGFRLVVASQVITDENRAQIAASAQSKPAQRTNELEKETRPTPDATGTQPIKTQAQATSEAKPQETSSAIEQQLRALQQEVAKLKSAVATSPPPASPPSSSPAATQAPPIEKAKLTAPMSPDQPAHPAAPPEAVPSTSRWSGTWKGSDGHRFTYSIQLNTQGTQTQGRILWTLAATPKGSRLSNRVGDMGTEYVKGTFDLATRRFHLIGTRVDDTSLIGTDEYKLDVAPDGQTIEGRTKGNSAPWTNELRGRKEQ